uniref:AlNc14C64G4598 protein n=1 Tax=Albugo laibachii Nc14 TaxID=890382 RepID=F0WD78_9STRA|nr:AlNc14C64G4598 [Albugo laibachii Nc14]|eukprot:CCA19150.1 AlNc14C64G4598 [Albugo laibachii Nc14]
MSSATYAASFIWHVTDCTFRLSVEWMTAAGMNVIQDGMMVSKYGCLKMRDRNGRFVIFQNVVQIPIEADTGIPPDRTEPNLTQTKISATAKNAKGKR